MSTISAGTTSTTTLIHSGDTTGSLVLKTNDTGSGGTTAVTIDTSQNVGIGTASPAVKLDVAGTTNIRHTYTGATGGVLFGQYNTTGDVQIQNQSSGGIIALATNNAERMRIDSSGNVGIGTSSPGAKLDVSGNVRLSAGSPNIELNNGGPMVYVPAGNTLAFATGGGPASPQEKMRIDSSGNLLVNTTSMPGSSNNILGIVYKSGGNGAGIRHPDSTGGSAPKVFDFCNSSNSSVGYIAVSGTSVAFTSTSDYRLKENVQPMTGALTRVAALKPCTYTWKSTGGSGQGFIAHELQEVVSDAVVGEKDAVDADGNPQYQGVDTSFLVATLTAAIQEQQALIQQLQADVAALKGTS